MKKKLLTIALLAIALVTSGYVVYRHTRADATPAYRTATVQRGNIESTVSATGSLGAVTTIQVGTQVSGQISAIYADFNTKVKKGQLIARIDPTLQQQAVADAETGVARGNATLQQTQGDYAREKQLHDSGFATDPEFETAQLNYQVAVANGKSAQIALDKAKQNLAYTSIYAPIDGIVVERDVDVGQTVAASLSAPQLFVIANDLSQMQILATVDESDIGQIQDGQPVAFTVQAYPGESFTGSVRQVRINSATVNNVVNYTAVISVANPDARLLPGMTATVKFDVGSAQNVLLVPNAALRFRPATTTPTGAATVSTATARARKPQAGAADSSATLWSLDAQGALAAVHVHTGLTDGTRTAVSGTGLTQGMSIVIGTATGTTTGAASAATTNPLQSQNSGRRGGPPGGF
ncbi:MAG: efflux RND transporter periplasmic adaptor subunit [Gemmatimonadaceae bacterium]